MKTGIFIPVFFLPFLPFCRGGLAPPGGRLNVLFLPFCGCWGLVRRGGGDDNRRWKVSETCETICFLLYKAGFSVRIGGTVYKAL